MLTFDWHATACCYGEPAGDRRSVLRELCGSRGQRRRAGEPAAGGRETEDADQGAAESAVRRAGSGGAPGEASGISLVEDVAKATADAMAGLVTRDRR